MKAHDEMDALADLYAAGGLEPGERREVESHAAQCRTCAAILAESRDFARWISGTIAPDAPPADLEDRIIGRLWKTQAKPKRRWRLLPGRRTLKIAGGLAAAACLIVLGAAFTRPGGWLEVHNDTLEDAINPSFAYEGPEVDNKVTPRRITLSREGDWGHLPAKDMNGVVVTDGISLGPKPWKFWGPDKTTDELLRFGSEMGWKADRGFSGVPASNRANAPAQTKNAEIARGPQQPPPLTTPPPTETVDNLSLQVEHSESFDSEAVYAKLKDYHAKLAKTLNEKSNTAAEVEYARKEAERLGRELDAFDQARIAEEKLRSADAQAVAHELRPRVPETPLQDNRKIIRNANLDLEVEAYEATQTKINETVAAEKGFVAGADTQRLANGKIRATVTVRVPPDRFEATLAKLRELGTVRHQNITSQDVTKAYVDLEARLGAKTALVERLKKVLAEAKGSVKELMEVEVQMGKTLEEIEVIKGELKYYDNLVGLSTIILQIAEKDLGQPFEYVQTLQSTIGVTTKDADDVYAKGQKAITDAAGQVVDSKMTRQNDGSAQATVRGRVDAEKFPAVREALKKLGHVDVDTVNQQKTARGGKEGPPKADAPLRREQAVIDLTIKTPPIEVTRRAVISIETSKVEEAYQAARKAVEQVGGRILDGGLIGRTDGMSAGVLAHVDAEKFAQLVETLKKTEGKIKNASVNYQLAASVADKLIAEKGEIRFDLASPPQLIPEEKGLGKVIRDTFSGSVSGILWSIEKLFVGLSLAGPWIALLLVGWLVWRRVRRKAKAAA